jgi:hypothetical protein
MFELWVKEKIFRQGFCYDCFLVLKWVIDYETRSTAHLGIEDRDLVYEQKYNNPIMFIWPYREVK